MGIENFGVASVTNTLVHQILKYLRNESVILKVQRWGFPLIPKSCPKVVIINKSFDLKLLCHFRSRTLYNGRQALGKNTKLDNNSISIFFS